MSLIAIVNGPNLNLLGRREPSVYGEQTWAEARRGIEEKADGLALEVEFFQSNHEGAIIDFLHGLAPRVSGLIINPGGLSHYSISLRDSLAFLEIPIVEVHVSNIFAREEWRARSVISPVVRGVITGLGVKGYELALEAMADILA